MTATQTTTPSIPKPTLPARGKQAAQGLLSIAPSSRTGRARSDAPSAVPTFADRLKEASKQQPSSDDPARSDAVAATAVREDRAPSRENDANAKPDGAGDPARTERQCACGESGELAEEPAPASTVLADPPVPATASTAQTEPLVQAVSSAAVSSAAVTVAVVESQAGPSSQEARSAAGRGPKVSDRAGKATIDPLGLISRDANVASAKPDPASQAKGEDNVEPAVPRDAVPETPVQPTAAEPQPLAQVDASTGDQAQASPQPAESKPHEAAHAEQKPKHESLFAGAAQPGTQGESHVRDAGTVLGIDLNASKPASQFGGGVKLVVQPHGLKPEAGEGGGEALSVQAARGLAAAFKHKGGTVTLNLTPESLGQIKVKITVEDSKVSALIQTSTEQAKRLLETSGDSLRAAMESKGLTVDRISIAHTPAAMSEARDLGRSAAAGDSNRQNEQAGERGGGAGAFSDQGRSDDDGSRQGWRQAASQANDMFGLNAMSGQEIGARPEELGAPIAMASLTRADTSREGIVRLCVDAVA